MAIGFDSKSGGNTTGTSLSVAHTNVGTVTMGFAGALTAASSGGDIVSGITWNGSAMTRLNTARSNSEGTRTYLYYLASTTTGNVVTSTTTSGYMANDNTAYTGSATTAPVGDINVQDTDSETFSITAAATPAATSWLVGMIRTAGDTISAGANTTLRNFDATYEGISDSNGTASPTALNWSVDNPGSDHFWSGCMATFDVAGGGGVTAHNLLVLGVGT